MKDEKLSIAKRKVYQAVKNLDIKQIIEVRNYIKKLENKKYVLRNKEREKEQFNEVHTWEPGIKIVCVSARAERLDGKTGTIIRHLGRGSTRTLIDFDDIGKWRIPSLWLRKATPEVIKQAKETAALNQGLGRILTKALNNMED